MDQLEERSDFHSNENDSGQENSEEDYGSYNDEESSNMNMSMEFERNPSDKYFGDEDGPYEKAFN